MRIYSMTATFGKLEHQTLTLQPGLNIIEAPNEWGKSTWCAFLVNMLYGIDTRARSTAVALADKERYAPWSGAAMEGRIDLCWNGRDITIERRSRGRIPFGDFRAYETETGIEISDLNATNCGQQLLGVERSVFVRAGFLKQSDLPVTQDDSLRRRLNNLVTTGDESGASDKLGEALKDLKNKCRHNRTGLLPQAESERDQLSGQLAHLHDLQNQAQAVRTQQSELELRIAALENHAAALRYAASLEDAKKVAQAEENLVVVKERLTATMSACQDIPSADVARRNLHDAQTLQEQWLSLQMESQMLPPLPPQPAIPVYYKGIAPADAVSSAEVDAKANAILEQSKKKNGVILAIFGILAVILCGCGLMMPQWLLYMGIAAAVTGIAGALICVIRSGKIRKQQLVLFDRHPGVAPDGWIADARQYAQEQQHYEALLANAQALRGDLDARIQVLQQKINDLAGEMTLSDALHHWSQAVAAWDTLSDARRDLQLAESHVQTLRSLFKEVPPPTADDTLTFDVLETDHLLANARIRQQQLHTQLGQCLGQAEALGSEALLRARLDTLNHRIARLEDTYYALEMALDALRDASLQLQRRFAPRISKRAQEIFNRLTNGRYHRLSLGSDLSLSTSTQDEDTLHTTQWRSDGTADQQYFALRLAVAEELTPDAPLILDDALVRFDDHRMKAAMQLLQESAQSKQVILFTCQSRENACL